MKGSFLASIPESYEIKCLGRSSDLLPEFGLPMLLMYTVAIELKTVIELTAAGQLRIYTVFPFNPGLKPGTKSRAKVLNY